MIVCADDFGLDVAVNEAVERAAKDGVLTCASIMMGAPAAVDAVARAKAVPQLRVGLHVTLSSGRSVLPPSAIPDLVDTQGNFSSNMVVAGTRYFFLPHVQRQIKAEIRAQFEAFAATGLALDHVNAHQHFHLHPTLALMIIAIGREFGMKAMRVPLESTRVLNIAARFENKTLMMPFYMPWIWLLGHLLRLKGLYTNDGILGLAWSGAMKEMRVSRLLEAKPPGVTELYFHPATARTPALVKAMPDYHHVEEFEALMSPRLRDHIERLGYQRISYADLPVAV